MGELRAGQLPSFLPVVHRACRLARLGVVATEKFRMTRRELPELRLDRVCDLGVDLTARVRGNALVGGLSDQRVTEGVERVVDVSAADEDIRGDHLLEVSEQRGLVA